MTFEVEEQVRRQCSLGRFRHLRSTSTNKIWCDTTAV